MQKYDALKDAPADTGPSWLPGDTTEVAVRTAKKGAKEKVGSTRIDGLLPAAGPRRPTASATPTSSPGTAAETGR